LVFNITIMKNFISYITTLLILVLTYNSVNAQPYYDLYQGADANMVEVQGNNHIEHTLKGATVLFPNGSNELNLTVNIPYNAVADKTIADAESLTAGYLFRLTMNIDPDQIQEMLTSTKSFVTHGFVTLNNVTKEVTVQYIPKASGTEEDGNFNIYMSVGFNPADFNLGEVNGNSQYVITINDAKVNRI